MQLPFDGKARTHEKRPPSHSSHVALISHVALRTSHAGQSYGGQPGELSPFTAELVKLLRQPGLELSDIGKRVTRELAEKRQEGTLRQIVEAQTTMARDFYFLPPTAPKALQ